MATLEEARSAFQNKLNRYEHKQKKRVVYLGDGRGNSASNLTVPANESYVYARDRLNDSNHFFPVKLNRNVRPAFNLPVWVGKREGEPYERIIDIVEQFADFNNSASIISGLAPHHNQHEFGGGDEVFVDSQLLKEGLIKPRNPPSSVIDVFGFYHATSSGWNYFSGESISTILDYTPSSGSRYVTVSYNPDSQQIALTQGDGFSGGTDYQSLIDNIGSSGIPNFGHVPAPPDTNYPLGAVLLNSSTTIFDWNQNGGVNNVFPTRLLLNKLKEGTDPTDLTDIYKRIRRSSLTTTGTQSYTTEQEFNYIDGGRF